ncbi:MAG TPA: glycosyltransferase family 87 protein [Vicinamibacterales bacterium]|nr:glycosyltransferase family 87 protein [Vicinamibacterales bacterium]
MRIDWRARPSRAVAALAIVAAVNLGVGLGLSLARPGSAGDLEAVRGWCRDWLFRGTRLYSVYGGGTDYPPNAIVVFSPIALVPSSMLAPLWSILSLALTPIVAVFVVRSSNIRARRTAIAIATMLFCCWGGVRFYLQFTRLCLTFAFLALLLMDSRPDVSGACLGLALAKPHIAGPIALWTLLMKRTRVVAVAAAVALAGLLIYDVRVLSNPIGTLTHWAGVLRALYGGPDALIGRTSIKPLVAALVPGTNWDDAAWVAASASLMLLPGAMTLRDAGRPVSPRSFAAAAMFCLWSLLSVFHLGHNFTMALPAFVFLLLVDDPPSRAWRWTVAAMMQVVLMLDVPIHVAPLLRPGSFGAAVATNADRIVVLTAFVAIALEWRRLGDPPDVRIPATN